MESVVNASFKLAISVFSRETIGFPNGKSKLSVGFFIQQSVRPNGVRPRLFAQAVPNLQGKQVVRIKNAYGENAKQT